MIIRSIKYYKWALNLATIKDYGVYTEAGDASLTFSANYDYFYYNRFTYGYYKVENTSNA